MKKAILICVLLVMVAAIFCPVAAEQAPRGFDTPDECARALFSSLQQHDVEAIEACYAIPEMARLFDYRKYCERLNAIPGGYYYMPSTTELGIAYNEAYLRSVLYRQIIFSSIMLVNPEYGEQVTSGKTYGPLDDDDYALISFLEDPSTMAGFGLLTLDSIVTPAAFPEAGEKFYSERNTTNRVRHMSMWPVEDNTELVIIANAPYDLVGNDKIIIPMRYVQIDGKWLADPTSSNFRSLIGMYAYTFVGLLSDVD